jgi:hypothetical protein
MINPIFFIIEFMSDKLKYFEKIHVIKNPINIQGRVYNPVIYGRIEFNTSVILLFL